MDDNREEVLTWFKELPGYREEIKRRVSRAKIERYKRDKKILRYELGGTELFGVRQAGDRDHKVDTPGQEIDGCG